MRVENTLLSQHVFLSGLTSTGSYAVNGGTEHGLLAILVRGTFRIQDCIFRAADGLSHTDVNDHGGDGAFLQHVFDGAFNSSEFQGGDGGESFDSACLLQRAGNGLWVQDSCTTFQGCDARAGDGQEFDLSTCDYGGQQGHGLRLVDGDLYLAGTALYGGRGGTEGLCSVIWPGGDGLHAQGMSAATVLDSSLNGGPSNVCGAPMGQSSVTSGGASISFLGGSSRGLGLPSPSRALDAENLTILGEPGDYAWLLLSLNPGRRDLVQAFSGTTHGGHASSSTAPKLGCAFLQRVIDRAHCRATPVHG